MFATTAANTNRQTAISKMMIVNFIFSPIVTPLNLISEFSTPVSMAFRHFGNIAAGLIITTHLYGALTGLTHMVFGANFQIPILAIGLPAVLSVYFDLFTAFMQAFIISMLTMVFTSMAMD